MVPVIPSPCRWRLWCGGLGCVALIKIVGPVTTREVVWQCCLITLFVTGPFRFNAKPVHCQSVHLAAVGGGGASFFSLNLLFTLLLALFSLFQHFPGHSHSARGLGIHSIQCPIAGHPSHFKKPFTNRSRPGWYWKKSWTPLNTIIRRSYFTIYKYFDRP